MDARGWFYIILLEIHHVDARGWFYIILLEIHHVDASGVFTLFNSSYMMTLALVLPDFTGHW